jgi:hypothetical protein
MNSLQLVSKIRSKTEDLSRNIQELVIANQDFTGMDKELLKKQCIDLYELLLKLKTEPEVLEEKAYVKPAIQPAVVKVPPMPELEQKPLPEIKPVPEPEPIPIEETLPVSVEASNFQDVINWAEVNDETLDTLVQKVETAHVTENLPDDLPEPIIEPKPFVEPNASGEINIGKAVENKRIQYTVMPDITEPKATPLNESIKDKEPTYNEKIALNNPQVSIPLVEKTIEAPIENIKSAINLNKKIAFVNELFKENVVEYAKAIDRLNNATDLNDAFRIQNELKHQYQWENTNELVQDLERLIKRRFA